MAPDLLKLVLVMTATSTTTLGPSQNGYYYLVAADTFEDQFVLAASSFDGNDGNPITEFPEVSTDGYYTVSVNGVQQMRSVTDLSTGTLTLNFTNSVTIYKDQVIELQIVDYDPTTVTTVEG